MDCVNSNNDAMSKCTRKNSSHECDSPKPQQIAKGWEYGPFVSKHAVLPHHVISALEEIAPMWIYGVPKVIGKSELGSAKRCQVHEIHKDTEDEVSLWFQDSSCADSMNNNAIGNPKSKTSLLEIVLTIRVPVFQIGPFLLYQSISRRCIECLRELQHFYQQNDNVVNLIVPIVNRTFDVSKRALEFCCVTKAKRDSVVYKYVIDDIPTIVDVHKQYNQWLKMWKRECFDFFQRYTRIYIPYEMNGKRLLVETTTGQVHGIYWAHTYGVIVYARNNLDTIMQDMSLTHGRNRRDIKKFKARGARRPRRPLVQNTSSSTVLFPMDITVYFDDNTDDYEEYTSDEEGLNSTDSCIDMTNGTNGTDGTDATDGIEPMVIA